MKVTKDYIAAAVAEAEKEFLSNRSAELAAGDPFGLFVEADQEAGVALHVDRDVVLVDVQHGDLGAVYFAADDEARAA